MYWYLLIRQNYLRLNFKRIKSNVSEVLFTIVWDAPFVRYVFYGVEWFFIYFFLLHTLTRKSNWMPTSKPKVLGDVFICSNMSFSRYNEIYPYLRYKLRAYYIQCYYLLYISDSGKRVEISQWIQSIKSRGYAWGLTDYLYKKKVSLLACTNLTVNNAPCIFIHIMLDFQTFW